MKWVATWFTVGMLAFGGALTVAYAPQANAEVSAGCWAHLAEIPPGETPAGDRRYHLAKGEPSPCSEQETSEVERSSAASRNDGSERHEEKSRFCKKKWFC